jgi:hypothetical protein
MSVGGASFLSGEAAVLGDKIEGTLLHTCICLISTLTGCSYRVSYK